MALARTERRSFFVCLLLTVAVGGGCAALPVAKERLVYDPDEFAAAIRDRVPGITPALATAPFLLDASIVARAENETMKAPRGPQRVEALVRFLSQPAPDGLGLRYDWSATGNAEATLAQGAGNCVSLASVLIGLGRGMGWPIYYAEARRRRPETREFQHLTALSDHMAVIVAARSFQMIIDFTGLIDEVEDLRPIDDLTAYAHVINNASAQRVLTAQSPPTTEEWETAVRGFRLATRVQPALGRAWNNLGIGLTRLGRFEDARAAYERAMQLDTAFGSAARNLVVMETRASGETSIREGAPSE